MLRYGFVMLMLLTSLFAAGEAAPELDERYHDSSKCKACHQRIVSEWSSSYHAMSHYDSNEYLRKSMDYVGRKVRRSTNAVKVQCAACHNPRIAVTNTDIDYEIQTVMKLDHLSKVNKALEDDALSEGINCLVCHNVDKIHTDRDESVRGVHRISWNKVGTMSGPFKDAKSPYHGTQYREFFGKDPKELCFVCHANDRSVHGLEFANTQKEYQESSKQCADCHMSEKRSDVASNLPVDNGKPRTRMVRKHTFIGAHDSTMWEGALQLKASHQGNELYVSMKNDNPHNIPTGFGSRELILEASYTSATHKLKQLNMSLTTHYKDKRGHATIPHLAQEATEDLSIPAHGERVVKFPIPEGASAVTVKLYYRLVNEEVHSLLELEEPLWSQKMFINKVNYRF